MKHIVFVSVISILLAACAGMSASTGLTEEQEAGITEGASAVVLRTTVSPDELYEAVKKAVLDDGYELADENADLRRMVTEDKNVGRRLRMHLIVRILPESSAAKVELTGKWAFEQSSNAMESTMGGTQRVQESTRDAEWINNSSSRYAYSRMVLLMDALPDGEITYEVR